MPMFEISSWIMGDGASISMIEEFDYIGHKFRGREILISSRGIARVKRRISKIIYIHLLHNLGRKKFDSSRVGGSFYDWDLVTCLNEIKTYIYGALKEADIRGFLEKNVRIKKFKGLMTFCPLVTSIEQFKELDGWLVSVLLRANAERLRRIGTLGAVAPHRLTRDQVLSGSWYQYSNQGITLETNAPSFVLGWRAARKAYKQYGLVNFERPRYYTTYFEFGNEY